MKTKVEGYNCSH